MKIEVFSDIACPYCYIGKRHLSEALSRFEHRDGVEVVWRSFQLQPDADGDGVATSTDMLVEKRGLPRDQVIEMTGRLREQAAAIGLDMHPGKAITANTRDAHRLLQLAKEHGLADDVKELLFRAHFTDLKDVQDVGVLRQVALTGGLPETEVDSLLGGDDFDEAVAADQNDALHFGVQGVPFFIFDRKFAVSGAQPVDAFERALEQTWADEGEPVTQ